MQEILICWIAHSEREYMNLSSLVKHGINLSVRAVLHALASRAIRRRLGLGCVEAKRYLGLKLPMI